MVLKWKQLFAVGFLSLLLTACNAENNDNDDLQNGNPGVGGDDDTEEPSGGKDTTDDLEDDVNESEDNDQEDNEE